MYESSLKRRFASFLGKFKKFIKLIFRHLIKKILINENFSFYTELMYKIKILFLEIY